MNSSVALMLDAGMIFASGSRTLAGGNCGGKLKAAPR